MEGPLTIEHGRDRYDRFLSDNRLKIALIAALVEGVLVLVGSIDWWVVVLVAFLAAALYVWRGRTSRNYKLRELSWILAVSQVAVVLVPALALVLTALAIFTL